MATALASVLLFVGPLAGHAEAFTPQPGQFDDSNPPPVSLQVYGVPMDCAAPHARPPCNLASPRSPLRVTDPSTAVFIAQVNQPGVQVVQFAVAQELGNLGPWQEVAASQLAPGQYAGTFTSKTGGLYLVVPMYLDASGNVHFQRDQQFMLVPPGFVAPGTTETAPAPQRNGPQLVAAPSPPLPTRWSVDLAGELLMAKVDPQRIDRIEKLTEGQVASIPAARIGALLDSLTRSQVQAMTDDQLRDLDTSGVSCVISVLHPAQVRALSDDQVRHMTSGDLGLVIGALSPRQLALLSFEQLSPLGVDQLQQLSAGRLELVWPRLTPGQRALVVTANSTSAQSSIRY